MKCTHVGRKPGDVVWAFAYSGENRIRGRKLRQPPVEGMLLSSEWDPGWVDTPANRSRIRRYADRRR